MSRIALSLLLLLASRSAVADVYLHHPRGSNNKLNEAGGYQIGDNCAPPGCSDTNNNYDYDKPGAGKGQLKYYESSYLDLEWTNQHGCGDRDGNVRCNFVIQYACEDSMPDIRDGYRYERTAGNGAANGDTNNGDREGETFFPTEETFLRTGASA
ncbi:hypothetical protein EMIHUDRAFT_103514 [Emiliania huxleyi CCMP1516]|uniref:Uncharacterized protein n=2 Tax=Emiliania huxleyi TaxID=2903 RepID=A0A0D3IT79_EMIH1|nr:hypothetical protein EMIHUDRAFT_103514 [Emiliania huxleyi CCMP1516]EOD14464.1 hypothetical protein EMIHUDRAFT_103514 [Emiliania huxleyi CCMP1516]|eukprot:XP_005766893.1 hypothetical protein EMIHUDRAFT_103514 [Emiliania huxleyi CCMP1516]